MLYVTRCIALLFYKHRAELSQRPKVTMAEFETAKNCHFIK